MSRIEPQPLPPGTLVNERYRVVAAVGRGGLGTVYLITDQRAGRGNVYALKEQWDRSESARKQFAREGAWLRDLDHPHIPKVIECFAWNDRLYLVMDYVEGENLEHKLERAAGRPLPVPHVIAWILPICDALQYLHTRTPPIIHRDVKPSNIIVTPSGHPMLVDFGIAKEHLPGSNVTATFVRKAGTEGYAPPEQYAAGAPSGPWSDVYGLGATLYQLLTAEIPPTAVERVALDARLAPVREINPQVGPAVDVAILTALQIRPQDRFQTVSDFRRALASALTPPTLAGPLVRAVPDRAERAFADSGPHVFTSRMPASPSVPSPLPPPSPPSPPALVSMVSTLHEATPADPVTPNSTRIRTHRAPAPAPKAASEPPDAARSRPVRFGHPVVWGPALAALVVAVAVVAVVLVRSNPPLNQSTPSATVSGYFDALRAQDYARAWRYTAQSSQDQASQQTFTASQKAADDRGGTVLSVSIATPQQDGSGHATCNVTVVRAGAPSAPATYVVNLTQYGSAWLIDDVTGT